MNIKAYLKPRCGWSHGVRAVFRKYDLPFEDIDIINNRDHHAGMVAKSGQPFSPCVEIDGVMLADVSGEEVENYLLANNLVNPAAIAAAAPASPDCSDGGHARPSGTTTTTTRTIRFF
jgi:monothiol glutaredoxin